METRECPLCGSSMRLKTRMRIDRIPGLPETIKKEIHEWICPECDYFEEIEKKSPTR